MGRGKNYFNQNKGMTIPSMKDGGCVSTSSSRSSGDTSTTGTTATKITLNSNKQKKSMVMEMCFYGKGCTRKGCIYKHPPKVVTTKTPATTPTSSGCTTTTTISNYNNNNNNNNQCIVVVNEKKNELLLYSHDDKDTGVVVPPCKPYLLNMCSFNAGTCLKRHVKDPIERQRLLNKYRTIPCRHGSNECLQKINGTCLYSHYEMDDEINKKQSSLFFPFCPVVVGIGSVPKSLSTTTSSSVPSSSSSFLSQHQTQPPQPQQQQQFMSYSEPMIRPPTAFVGSSLRVAVPTGGGIFHGSVPNSTTIPLPIQSSPLSSSSSSSLASSLKPMNLKPSILTTTTTTTENAALSQQHSTSTVVGSSSSSSVKLTNIPFQNSSTIISMNQITPTNYNPNHNNISQQQQQQQQNRQSQQQHQQEHKPYQNIYNSQQVQLSSRLIKMNSPLYDIHAFPPLDTNVASSLSTTKRTTTEKVSHSTKNLHHPLSQHNQQDQEMKQKKEQQQVQQQVQSLFSSSTVQQDQPSSSLLSFNINAREFIPSSTCK